MNTRNVSLYLFPYILIFYEIITYLSNDLYLPALPALMQDFHTSTEYAQLTLTTWFLGSASTQLFLGPLSDRYGRRPILFLGAVIFILSTTACAITHSLDIFLVARVFQGSAVCSLIVAGYAAVHELYDTKRAIQVLAMMASVGILGPAFGPLLGGFILQIASWRILFWLLTINAIIALVLLYKWMPESHPVHLRKPIAIKNISISYYSIIKNRSFILSTLVLCLGYGGLIAWLSMGPLLVIDAFHYSPVMFGFFQALIFGAFIFGNMWVKPLMEKYAMDKVILFGLWLTFAGAVFAIVASLVWAKIMGIFIVALIIFSGGTALQYAPLQREAIEASQEPMGLRMAIFSSCLGIAGVVSSAVAGYIYLGKTRELAYFLLFVAAFAILLKFLRKTNCILPELADF